MSFRDCGTVAKTPKLEGGGVSGIDFRFGEISEVGELGFQQHHPSRKYLQ